MMGWNSLNPITFFLSGSVLEEGEIEETVVAPADAGSAVPSASAVAAL